MFTKKLETHNIMSPEDEDAIHEATLKVLEQSGVEVVSDKGREYFAQAGVEVEDGKVYPSQKDLEKFLAMAPSEFEMKARNPDNNVTVGGDNTVLVPGYGPPFVMEYEGERRDSTFEDYKNFTRLAQWSDALDVVGGVLVEPTDIEDRIRHGKMMQAGVTLSDKCLMGSAMGAQKASECLDMAAIVFESEKFVEENVVLVSLINTNSPLQLDERMTDALMVYSENQQAMCIASLAMTGTTSPTTMPAALVQQNAEILTGIILTQIINPGTPVIYGSASSVVDLRGADLALGSPETAKMFNGTAQMARRYELPSRGGGALTDSLFPDAQAGYEAMLNVLSGVMGGFNFMLHSAGLLENYMCMSYEKFIIDSEICGMVKNYMQGLEVNEDTLGADVINEIGPGGNYISHDHTFQHMKDMRQPELSSRQKYFSDEEQPEAEKRAHKKCQDILDNFTPPELPAGIEQELENYIKGLSD